MYFSFVTKKGNNPKLNPAKY